jgi:hypothetical protein
MAERYLTRTTMDLLRERQKPDASYFASSR